MSRRVGRGNSSKYGNTCGRGQKGQKSRSGYSRKILFEGGQTIESRRMKKFGFRKKKILVKEYTLSLFRLRGIVILIKKRDKGINRNMIDYINNSMVNLNKLMNNYGFFKINE